MPLAAAAIIPHGGIVADPDILTQHPGLEAAHADALELQHAAREAALALAAPDPSLIVLITPHGFASDSDWGIYTGNDRATGNASGGAARGDPPVEVALDTARSKELLAALRDSGVAACGISFGSEQGSAAWPEPSHVLAGSREAMPMFWGEVNPLYFAMGACDPAQPPRVVIISLPTRQDGHQKSFHAECVQVAEVLSGWVDSMDGEETVAMLVSADLAHTHPSQAHLPGYTKGPGVQPFAISAEGAAKTYDEAVGEWASTLSGAPLLETAADTANDAHCDNHLGFMVLHAMLQADSREWQSKPEAHCLKAPMYFGMLVAAMAPEQPPQQQAKL
jgi:aromatic ring-opening dioxygenase LigB subunit